MRKLYFVIILILLSSCTHREYYMDVLFAPKLEKFCGTYYMNNSFYEKNNINLRDTIKIILNKDFTFTAKNLPIKKYLQNDISKIVDVSGTWNFDNLEYIMNSPKDELNSSLGLSLNFDDKKNVLKDFENIKTNKKDSTKYLLMTYFLDSDDSKGFIQFRK